MQAAAEGCTVFFSSHQISEVERIADEVFIRSRPAGSEGSLEDLRQNFRRMHFAFPGRTVEEMSLAGVRNPRLTATYFHWWWIAIRRDQQPGECARRHFRQPLNL